MRTVRMQVLHGQAASAHWYRDFIAQHKGSR
jgi:hypothetical protein